MPGYTPFPQEYRSVHRYAETVTHTTGTAGVAGSENIWALTGIYDPNITGTGHQPYGFDQLTPLYARYIVEEVEAEVRFLELGGTQDICCVMMARNSQSYVTTGSNTDTLTENPAIMTKNLSPYGSNRTVVFRRRFKPWDLLGITRQQFLATTSDYYSGTASSNPAYMPYLVTNTSSYDGTAGVVCRCQVVLTYHVKWFERKLQTSS